MAVRVTNVYSVLGGDLLVIHFAVGFETLKGVRNEECYLTFFPHQPQWGGRHSQRCSSFLGSALCLEGAAESPCGEISLGGFYSPGASLFEIIAL